MKYLTCYLASVSMLAIVSSGHAFEDPPQMEPLPYVNGPFMSTFDPNLPADAGKPVVILDTNPTVVELPEALTNPTLLAKQEIGRQTPRTRGAGGEAAPLGGAPRPPQSAPCPNLDETLRAICDDGIEPKLVADKPGGIGSDYVASREDVVDLKKAAQGKEAAQQNEEAGRPFWQLDQDRYGHFDAAKQEIVPLPRPRPESYTIYTTERFGPFTVIVKTTKSVIAALPEIVVNIVRSAEVPTIEE